MGYYENPPIINMNAGYDQISAGILSGSNAIAQGLLERGKRRQEAEDKKKITLEKLVAQRNQVDLAYADSMSDWKEKYNPIGNKVDDAMLSTIERYNTEAADARIALLNESDPSKRKELLGLVTRASDFMKNTASYAKAFGGEVATNREGAKAGSYGQPGGYAINGAAGEIEPKQMFLNVFGGMDQTYDDVSIDFIPKGSEFDIVVKGKKKGTDQPMEYTVNSASYLKADAGSTGTFLQKVENVDDFGKSISQTLYDPKTGMHQTYLDQNFQTTRVGGNKIYSGQLLDTDAVKKVVAEKAEVKAKGYLMAGNEASLRALVNYTLTKDPHYYDDEFKILGEEEKQARLTELFTQEGFNTVTKKLFTSDGSNGQKLYWGPDTKVVNERIEKAPAAKKSVATPAGTDSKAQTSLNSRIKDVISTGQGGIMKNGYTLEKDEKGLWSLRDKDGLPKPGTENQHDPYVLQKYIGGTLKRGLK